MNNNLIISYLKCGYVPTNKEKQTTLKLTFDSEAKVKVEGIWIYNTERRIL